MSVLRIPNGRLTREKHVWYFVARLTTFLSEFLGQYLLFHLDTAFFETEFSRDSYIYKPYYCNGIRMTCVAKWLSVRLRTKLL